MIAAIAKGWNHGLGKRHGLKINSKQAWLNIHHITKVNSHNSLAMMALPWPLSLLSPLLLQLLIVLLQIIEEVSLNIPPCHQAPYDPCQVECQYRPLEHRLEALVYTYTENIAYVCGDTENKMIQFDQTPTSISPASAVWPSKPTGHMVGQLTAPPRDN